MKYKFFLLILLFVIAYSCKSSGAIEESVILKTKEPLENNYRPKKLYKTPSDIENLDSIVKSKKNPFHNGVDMPATDNGNDMPVPEDGMKIPASDDGNITPTTDDTNKIPG